MTLSHTNSILVSSNPPRMPGLRSWQAAHDTNARAAWWLIALGMASGAVMGLWSFAGPAPAPSGFVDYADLPRRLFRLAHIALIALPMINLEYLRWCRDLDAPVRAHGPRLMLFGCIALPLLLAASAFWLPARYLLPVPVLSLIAAVVSLALELGRPHALRGEAS